MNTGYLPFWLLVQKAEIDCAECLFMSENTFKAKELSLRAQKKILSKISSKSIAKVFIDDTTSALLDNIYKLAKQFTQSKKEAEKLVKNIIKIVIKIAILNKNNQFSEDEYRLAEQFQKKFHLLLMTVISFYEVDFSFDLKFLQESLTEVYSLINSLIKNHLTDKTLGRLDEVFQFFSNPVLLESIFKSSSEYHDIMNDIIQDVHKALENGLV